MTHEEIKHILDGRSNGNILLIMDGHDEYKPGTNSDVDGVILKRKFGNCSMILTSRVTKEIADIKDYMDVETEIPWILFPKCFDIHHKVTWKRRRKRQAAQSGCQ